MVNSYVKSSNIPFDINVLTGTVVAGLVIKMFFGQNQEDKMIIDEDSSPSIITLDPIKYILPLLDPVKRDINEFSGNIKPLQAVKLNEVL